MHKEYIDKNALLNHLFNKQGEPFDVMLEIARFPSVDEGQKKGCEFCNTVHTDWDKGIKIKHCPACGRSLKGTNDE